VCQRTCLLRWRPTHGCRTWRSWRLRKSPNRMMKIPWSFSSRCRPPLAPRGLLSLKFQQLESHPAYVRTGVAMPTTGSSCCVAASNLSCDRLPRTGRRGVFGGRIERDRNGQTHVFRVAPVPRTAATGESGRSSTKVELRSSAVATHMPAAAESLLQGSYAHCGDGVGRTPKSRWRTRSVVPSSRTYTRWQST